MEHGALIATQSPLILYRSVIRLREELMSMLGYAEKCNHPELASHHEGTKKLLRQI